MATKEPSQQLDPRAVSAADMARLLSAAGNRKITADEVQADIDAGAPVNAGGTINLIHYAAWLTRESGGEAGDVTEDNDTRAARA